jgi:hypothetical protein
MRAGRERPPSAQSWPAPQPRAQPRPAQETRGTHPTRIAQDVESADLSGVSGTPTFFINGQRHYGAYDIDTLTAAITAERQRIAAIT